MENRAISDEEFEALMARSHEPERPAPAPVPAEAAARRNHRWLVYNLRANLYWRGRDYHVKVNDVSRSGLGLEAAPNSLQNGARAILLLDLDEYGTVAVPIEIVHVHCETYSQRLGIRFMPCEPEDLYPLEAYIDDLAAQVPPETSF